MELWVSQGLWEDYGAHSRNSLHRHCEEPLRRSNAARLRGRLDCFAVLAMTEDAVRPPATLRPQIQISL
ncbi:hypothetical protein XH96_09445 [Bradyrhizobium sp. CCBAU 51765]|nr:hypothetical protein XH96_09445 [Bradyrhizobium sp. CCBAU 51765]